MPIYEFYCADCNTIYSFLSRRITTVTVPHCPGCGHDTLQRQVSPFAVLGKARAESDAGDPLSSLNIDESKMEQAMASLASQADGMNDEDPRAAAQLIRSLSDMTGLKFTGGVEEALSRLEAGEDPQSVEAGLENLLEGGELPFELPACAQRRPPRPRRDEKLYDME